MMKTGVAAMEASGAEHLAKIDALESHECKLLDENQRPEHQLVMARVEEERHEAQDVEGSKAVTDTKF